MCCCCCVLPSPRHPSSHHHHTPITLTITDHTHHHTPTTRRDGRVSFRVFDPVAVRLSVQEGLAHRRSLLLELVPREQLPDSERV